MAERKTFWESSKPPKGEEGVLGPIDTFNRASYRISKPAAFISGAAVLIGVPMARITFMATGLWAGSDKLQIEGSKWLKRKNKKDMKPGREYALAA